MTMKKLFFFCQLFVTGAVSSQSLAMTQAEADQHLADLQKGADVKSAYMRPIDIFSFV